ncbi:hypothetical protein M405DRAFT_837373, partial [Rhizopogon salebrosus TDB-379]
DVAPARDEDRYGIAPATEAEMAAAMQYAISNEVNGSAHQGGAAAGVQGPQEGSSTQTAQGENLAALTEESSDLIGYVRTFSLAFDVKIKPQKDISSPSLSRILDTKFYLEFYRIIP